MVDSFMGISMLTFEARYQRARMLFYAARGEAALAEEAMDAMITQMLAEGTAIAFDSVEALMEHLKAAERKDEIV